MRLSIARSRRVGPTCGDRDRGGASGAGGGGPPPGTTGASAQAPAASWELTSVAQSPGGSAFAVGYSTSPSTAPVAMRSNGSSWP